MKKPIYILIPAIALLLSVSAYSQTTLVTGSPNVNDINRFKGDVQIDSIVRLLSYGTSNNCLCLATNASGYLQLRNCCTDSAVFTTRYKAKQDSIALAALVAAHSSNVLNPHNTSLQQVTDVDSNTTRQMTARKFVANDTSNINAGTINLIRTVSATSGTNNMKGFVDATVWKRNAAIYAAIDLVCNIGGNTPGTHTPSPALINIRPTFTADSLVGRFTHILAQFGTTGWVKEFVGYEVRNVATLSPSGHLHKVTGFLFGSNGGGNLGPADTIYSFYNSNSLAPIYSEAPVISAKNYLTNPTRTATYDSIAVYNSATKEIEIAPKPATGSVNYIAEETPSGSINGSNTIFALANTPAAGTVTLFLNGLRQRSGGGNDYTISGATITYNSPPQSGDVLTASYIY